MNKKTKRWAMLLAVVLAAMLLLTFIFGIIAQSATTINSLKEQQKVLAAEKARLKKEREKTINEKKSLINQKYAIDDQIANTEAEIENTTLLIQEYTLEIALTQERLDKKSAEIKDKEEKFLQRMRAMEEAGDISYISVLMQSSSFSDLLGRISMISEIAESDRQVIAELQEAREEIAAEKAKLETEKDEQQASRRLLADTQLELSRLYDDFNAKIAELEEDEKEFAAAEAKAEEEMKASQKEMQKLMEAAKKKNNGPYVGGTMALPAPEYTRVSSPFGNRIHPILKVNKFHSGVDLAAPKNTPIVAANDGTVLYAKWSGGYGNCVLINHGGGISTLYAHASKLLVKDGQTVKRGEKIALIGSTGTSTGNHLHFEVIKDGVHQDPETKEWLGTR